MAKSRSLLSDPELIVYSKHHVLYEVGMLVECARLLRGPTPIPMNVVVESFAVHVRNLVDFLYPGKNVRSTDVLADDFFPQGTRPASFPTLPAKLETARIQAHKQISHLTTGRLNPDDPGKQWHGELVVEILPILVEFVTHASPDKLDRSVIDFVLKLRLDPHP